MSDKKYSGSNKLSLISVAAVADVGTLAGLIAAQRAPS